MAAQRDDLTGLWNGAALEERLQEHIERERKPGAIAVIDIDNFKPVNDRLGHDFGNRVLTQVGKILQEVASGDATNMTARLRGDEFAIFFPEQDADDAFAIVEEARRRVQDAALSGTGAADVPRVTISAGVAASPRDATGVTDLLRKAEDGLWRAKKGSRNRIGLPSDDRMVLKSTYYATGQLERLGALAAQRHTTEASLQREALDDLLRKYADQP
ncbi:MAG: GGDEF domain-containing protein [Dehalococcoidia bacterium]